MSTLHKPSPALLLALTILALLLSPGCAFRQKTGSRVRSFAPYAGRCIGSTEIGTFLSSRVALLVSDDRLPLPDWQNGDLCLPSEINLGCAAAIDRRGYFLTAAHCLKQKTVYLFLFGPGIPTRALRARVVWQGKGRNGGPDLAVLHVGEALDHVFAWADEPHKGAPVMAVGLALRDENLQGFEWMGGKIFDCRRRTEGNLRATHDVPLQSGDSGGPLLDSEARLIGINIEATPPLVHLLLPKSIFPAVSECPDAEQVADIIEKDVAAQRASPP